MKAWHRISTLRGVAGIAAVAPFVIAGGANADVAISSGATSNMSCANGVCAPTAADAVLNAGDLETMLASGNVAVTTTGAGVQATNIDVTDGVSWSTGSALTLDAYRSIAIEQPVSVQGLAGLAVVTDDGGSGGAFSFGKKGNVTFANLSSSLTIDGAAYTLENSVRSLARAIAANPAGAYALANSYDASQDGTYTASPVSTTFTGSFEGLGNTISRLSINDPVEDDNVGLFAELETGGALENVRLQKANVKGAALSSIGGLVGLSYGAAVSRASVSGTVSMEKMGEKAQGVIGGLIGYALYGPIASSDADVSVNGNSTAGNVGGLIGTLGGGSLTDSHATGPVAGRYVLGGLIGGVFVDGTVDQCYATGAVTGGYGNSYTGSGGLVGGSEAASITNSYSTGNVSQRGRGVGVGGLIGVASYGEDQTVIGSSYSTGVPTGTEVAIVGGFLGINENNHTSMTDAYWDTTTSGTKIGVGEGSDVGLTGLTTKELKSGLPTGFDPSIWGQNRHINGGLPYLLASPPPKTKN